MKKILIIFILIFLTGCSAEYNLNISNNSFKENINVTIPNNMIPEKEESKTELGIEKDDQLTPFLEEKTNSLMNSDKFYKKKIKKLNDYTQVNMSYKYNENNFKEANSINLCFEYPELDFTENYYINLQGKFYCLYGDSVDIKIKTNNKVLFNNADEKIGNVYVWHIDESKIDFVDIKIEVSKGISIWLIIGIVSGLILLGAIGFCIYKIYIKSNENNQI